MEKKSERIEQSVIGNVMVWQVPGVVEDLKCDVGMLSTEICKLLTFHGLGQKVKDSAALPYKRPDGSFRKPTPREKFEAMRATVQHLILGEWSAAREASGGFLFRALNELQPGRFAKVAEFDEMVEKAAEQKGVTKKAIIASLESNPRVKPIIDRMKAEMVGDVDSDEVLDGFLE